MIPPGRRKKGRPRNSWMHEVTTGMRGKGELHGMGRERIMRWKIKQKCENIDTLHKSYIYTHILWRIHTIVSMKQVEQT